MDKPIFIMFKYIVSLHNTFMQIYSHYLALSNGRN